MGSDPLVTLGLQDISVNVDFTTLAIQCAPAGLQVIGVTVSEAFLPQRWASARGHHCSSIRVAGAHWRALSGPRTDGYAPIGLRA